MKMECSGKREIIGEVKKEWIEAGKEWKNAEEKKVAVVKREDKIGENEMHLSKPNSFSMTGQTITCREKFQSWIINRELKSVCILSHNIFLYCIYIILLLFVIYREYIDCLECILYL